MKPVTRQWVEKAEADYDVATGLSRRRKRPVPDHVCFLCQQAAEKYLKAFLQENAVAFPKTHDLPDLLALATPVDPALGRLLPQLRGLTDYAVDFRYPGTNAVVEDAKDAVKAARVVRTAFRKCLGLAPPRRRKKS